MTSLASLARALGGDVVGRQVLAPGPGHSARDRSMAVWLSPTAPDGFLAKSFAKDEWSECKDYIRSRLGWDRGCWRKERQQPMIGRLDIDKHLRQAEPDGDDIAKIERARRIWAEGSDPRRTLVEKYLASRGLEIPEDVAGEALRFHPACPWKDEASGRTIRVPAMIAAMRSIATEEIAAIHRTRLSDDGRKVDRRMLGKASGSAIMLCPFSAVGGGLTIGEGIETSLAAWQLGWSNTWAVGSVGAIASFPLLAGIQAITLLCETDDHGASAKAIDAVGCRYADAGREVTLITPTMPGDMNDVVMRGAA